MGYPGDKTEFFKIAASATDVSPPTDRRFSEIHVAVGGVLTLQGSGMFQAYAESAEARSVFKSSSHTGKMDESDSVVAAITAVEAVAVGTVAADTSGVVTVTRDGADVTGDVTVPAFEGIDYDGSAVTDCVVTATVGEDLKVGDVISFACTTTSDLTLSFTLVGDDLDLAAGYYEKKAKTDIALTVVAGEVVHCNATQISTDSAVIVTAFLG